MFPRIPFDRVNWLVSSFLIGTLFLSVTAVPLYLWFFGIDWFQIALFFAMFGACGFSISLGYHRLFSHLTFRAHWIVRLFTVVFGAGAFENSVLLWSCEHRSHHKHVDHDDDPYCITKGLFYAHMGWLMFKLKPLPPFDNVADLKKDPLLVWQDRYIHLIAVLVAFVLPASIGFMWGGWKAALGAFLIAGVANDAYQRSQMPCVPSPPGKDFWLQQGAEGPDPDWRLVVPTVVFSAAGFLVLVISSGAGDPGRQQEIG